MKLIKLRRPKKGDTVKIKTEEGEFTVKMIKHGKRGHVSHFRIEFENGLSPWISLADLVSINGQAVQ